MFKSWSIKAQLQILVISMISFVLLCAAMANFAHKFVAGTQTAFNEKLMPLSAYSRDLNHAFSRLIQHYQLVSTASNKLQLDTYQDRSEVELTFEQIWKSLNKLMSENNTEDDVLAALQRDYQDFLSQENDLIEYKTQYLSASASITQLKQKLTQYIDDLEQVFDEVDSAFQISGSTYTLTLIEALKLDVLKLGMVAYQIAEMQDDEALKAYEQNQLATLISQTQSSLTSLDGQLSEPSDMALSHKLSDSFDKFFELIRGKQGLVALKKTEILSSSLLKQTQANISAVMSMMLNKQGDLMTLIHAQIYQTVLDNAVAVEKMRWKIVVYGLLFTLVMLVFSFLLIRNINQSLLTIRNGVHALTEGKFETRLPTLKTHTEFRLLAQDFNQFAEHTESAIEAFALARDSGAEQEQYLRTVLNAVPEAILTISADGQIQDANPAAEKVLDASQQQLLGEDIRRFFADISVTWTLENITEKAKKGYEFQGLTYNERPIVMQVSFSQILYGEEAAWVCVITDVTQLKQTDQQLHQTGQELNAIFENAMVGIALIRDRKIIRVNHKFETLFGYSREEIEKQSTRALYPNSHAYEQFGRLAYEPLSQGHDYDAQIEMRRKDGSLFWCAVAGKAIDYDGTDNGSIWLLEDVTQQRENEERLTKLASIDTLTGLPNRTVFNDRLAHAIHKAKRDSGRLAVFFMDLDHFKNINDSLGHRIGDLLLVEVARRVKSSLREGDTVARLGGDEFTVILEDIKSTKYVGSVAEKVLESASKPYMIEGVEINVSPSIGISLYPADGRDLDILIRNADAAMYHAKSHGRNNFQFYSAEMNAKAAERLIMETAVRKAVERKEFFLHYQPQINLKTGEIEGAEALLRWRSEQWGDVSPAVFVPILEDTGLITHVGELVLEEACHTYVENKEHLAPNFKMAVNLSSRQFKGGNLPNRVNAILQSTSMPAANLELEITESLLMDDTELAIETLSGLSQQGINLAVDDFGTGYSSLSYLKRFPLNVLKIDGSFVRDITTDMDDAAIVDAIMALAYSLNLRVVAEGVEIKEQLTYLSERGCDYAQGYFFSRPLDKSAFIDFIHQPFSPAID